VRLVHGKERNAGIAQPLRGRSRVEPFGRHVQQLHVATLRARKPVRDLIRCERAIDECRGQAARDERVDLVLHERDQWRDDDRQLGKHQRRYLIAQRFAAASRQHHQRVTASQDRLDSRLLPGPKRGVPEMFRERGACGVERQWRGIRLHEAKGGCGNLRAATKKAITLVAHA
jgi:hypothetical protein